MTLLAIPAGCQILRTAHRIFHPAGVRLLTMPEPRVSLRSTPGYLLASLQDVPVRLLRLASIPPKTAKNLGIRLALVSEFRNGSRRGKPDRFSNATAF